MNTNASQAVLEEVLRFAIEEALSLQSKDPLSEEDQGALTAYFSVIEFCKQQAATMEVSFNDHELTTFDPYMLFNKTAT